MNLFNRLFFTMLLIVGLPAISMAEFIAVLETVENPKGLLTQSEKLYITNVLRELALQELPTEQNYTIMTRENINAMLPPGKNIEDCEGNCAVETGRNISADFVAQAVVGKFGEELTINVELYETASSKLVASANGRSENIQGLATVINEKAPALFQKAKRAEPAIAVDTTAADTTIATPEPTAEAPVAEAPIAEAPVAETPIAEAPAPTKTEEYEPDTLVSNQDSLTFERSLFRHGPWIHFGQFSDEGGLFSLAQSYEIGYAMSFGITETIDVWIGLSFEHITADKEVETEYYGASNSYDYHSIENGYSYGITIPLKIRKHAKGIPFVWYFLGYKFRPPSFAKNLFTEPNDVTAGFGFSTTKFDLEFICQIPTPHGYFDSNIDSPQMGLTLTYWVR